MSKKGQASLEQMIVTGLGLLLISLVFYFAINYATDSVRAVQAKDSVDKIAKAADYVYALGPNSKTTIDVFMPDGIQLINFSGRRIALRVSLSGGDGDVFANTRASLNGTLDGTAGRQKIVLVTSSNGSIVSISG